MCVQSEPSEFIVYRQRLMNTAKRRREQQLTWKAGCRLPTGSEAGVRRISPCFHLLYFLFWLGATVTFGWAETTRADSYLTSGFKPLILLKICSNYQHNLNPVTPNVSYLIHEFLWVLETSTSFFFCWRTNLFYIILPEVSIKTPI